MKKQGILNANLIGELTKLRHTDKLVICDAGFPIPSDATYVDISLVAGVPTMLQVLKAILNEIIVEEYAVFDLMEKYNNPYYDEIAALLYVQKSSKLSMDAFYAKAENAKLFVRTGDLLPCSNILLVSASGVSMMCEPLNVTCE